jgi:hypothetical protein
MLVVVPIELTEANAFIEEHHRHHKPVVGHRFSIGCVDTETNKLVGISVIGRPVARNVNHRTTVEVTRLCTDGTRNACSFLYSASARIAKEMGFCSIQTYILDTETGISLKASGWLYIGTAGGGQWKHTDGKPRRTDQPICLKGKWIKELRTPISDEYLQKLDENKPDLFSLLDNSEN